MENRLNKICSQFQLEGTILSVKPLGEGFINDTLLITTAEATTPNYILQRKNKRVFCDIPAMMENIRSVTSYLKAATVATGGDASREVLTQIPLRDFSQLYWQDEEGEYWTVCEFVPGSIAYERVDTTSQAFEGGRGIGRFHLRDYMRHYGCKPHFVLRCAISLFGNVDVLISGLDRCAWRVCVYCIHILVVLGRGVLETE